MCDVGNMYLSLILTVLFFGLYGSIGTPSRSKYFTGVFLFIFAYTVYSYIAAYVQCNAGFANNFSVWGNLLFLSLIVLNVAGGILSWRERR